MRLRVALVGGPMYDHLYEMLRGEDVEIVIHADHPTLNREAAALLGSGERLDVLSTHSKYAPSQARWLRPMDELMDGPSLDALAPKAVELCTFRDQLLSVPRCVDVRVLWARSDRVDHVPHTWDEMEASSIVFGFPGRESGLFGTFFEIVVSQGGRLFDENAKPVMESDEAVRAVELLCNIGSRAPSDLPEWHYDQVDAALLDGRLDAAAAWPGGYGPIRDSAAAEQLEPQPYVGGVSYAGVHSWAIPTTCKELDAAVALISKLINEEAALLDASGGNIPANEKALGAVEPANEIDARRLEITRDTIANAMITYPPLERFPEVEDAGWHAINGALRGELSPRDAVASVQLAAQRALG
jgi:multiple sugar transport system substrate-binding protein